MTKEIESQKPLRTPVRLLPLKKKPWAMETKQVVLGVDPGFAETGVVILERERPGSPIQAVLARHIKTEKMKRKLRVNFRVTTDDQRRWKEIWGALDAIRGMYEPYALGVEAYVLNPRQKGSIFGIKTLGVYTGVLWWGWSRNMYAAGFLPQDLKRRFCGKQSASKKEVEDSILQQVIGLAELLGEIPETLHEHIFDAAGHAVLVLEETDEMRKMLGLA